MDIQFMKDYYDLRYEETDGENHFVEETAYQEKQSEHSKMEDQLMEMVGGTGIITLSAAARALIVIIPRDGIQSMSTTS